MQEARITSRLSMVQDVGCAVGYSLDESGPRIRYATLDPIHHITPTLSFFF